MTSELHGTVVTRETPGGWIAWFYGYGDTQGFGWTEREAIGDLILKCQASGEIYQDYNQQGD